MKRDEMPAQPIARRQWNNTLFLFCSLFKNFKRSPKKKSLNKNPKKFIDSYKENNYLLTWLNNYLLPLFLKTWDFLIGGLLKAFFRWFFLNFFIPIYTVPIFTIQIFPNIFNLLFFIIFIIEKELN